MNTSVMILVVMAALGVGFGLILAYANRKFAVEVNPLIHIVEDVLPKGQCGACGYAGCMAYAEAVVLNPDVPPNLCIPGKAAIADQVAELTGKKAEAVEPRVATVACGCGIAKAKIGYMYNGIETCAASNVLFGGPKLCPVGCLGFGDCSMVCPFGAITMGEDRLPIIDPETCTGCGACMSACPKQIITMTPLSAKVVVNCKNPLKGLEVKNVCPAGCIACTICMRQCPYGAIVMENNLPVVDHSKCAECPEPKCTLKCPPKTIRPVKWAPESAENTVAEQPVPVQA